MTGDARIPDHVGDELVGFVRALRRGGAAVPANAATTAGRALAEVGVGDRDRAKAALRASLLTDREDFATFDRLFEEFWRRLTETGDADSTAPISDPPEGGLANLGASDDDAGGESGSADRDDGEDGDSPGSGSLVESFASAVGDDTDDSEDATTALYSPSGSETAVDPTLPTENVDLGAAVGDLSRALASLQSRRYKVGGDHADVRRALRASVSTGGTVLSVPTRQPRRTAVRARVLVDVSRSVLDAVDRGFLVDFLRRVCGEWRDTRVFFFDEDLREVTDAVDAPSAAAAMEALAAAETAWGGGTRIGASLARLRETAPDAVDRRTVVVVVSDGLEMGDVNDLERELSRLARRSKRLLWLNPLAAAESYEPTARGMAAALPFLDGLFAFAGPDDVAELARQLRRHGPGGPVGYQFDARTKTNRQTTARRTNDS